MMKPKHLAPIIGGALASLALFSFVSAEALAQAPLTAEEINDGWISLFDGETLFGWNRMGDVDWQVVDGAIVAERGSGGTLFTTSQFGAFELSLRVASATNGGVLVRAGLEGHPSENGSAVLSFIPPRQGRGGRRGAAAAEPTPEPPAWREVRVRAEGDTLAATIDGQPAQGFAAARQVGYIGIQYHHQGGRVAVRDVKLRPLAMKSLFNGRDLTGWKIIPGRRSEFAVIDGAINIKNGNGQIETEEVFKDFILQMDIFSNGDRLNSGVFWRGVPDQFWLGYESQIRNEWRDGDRTRPVDYGTGGNYGNQPARRVIGNDREWFKKTLVVDGAHAGIWIDGYLVSDFTETRPIARSRNGKDGYVAEAGTIHLQGHDPTTDLSFKKIEIQAYTGRR
jgi:hypothetical protein